MRVVNLSKVEKCDLRAVWQNEASDFTPWLAEHIDELGEALGLDLEILSQEERVGAFSLDLMARESVTNRIVIIENQLEKTDHDHLGKLLAYAGGLDADLIMWVAKEFRDEHKQTIDWLNQRTDANTEFFGIGLELWQIDGSRPAPYFNVVAAPNAWRREATASTTSTGDSERGQLYRSFFQGLIDQLREAGFTNARKGQPQSWYSFQIGYGPRAQFTSTFKQGNKVTVELYIDSAERSWNKALYDRLAERQKPIEQELGEPLEWRRYDEGKHSKIFTVRDGSINADQESLEQTQSWMFERLLSFKKVLSPHLDELIT